MQQEGVKSSNIDSNMNAGAATQGVRKREEYDSISTSTRRALIKLIFEHNVSIRIATNYLGLKYSTGKTLV